MGEEMKSVLSGRLTRVMSYLVAASLVGSLLVLASSTPAQAAADAAITGTVRGPDGPARNVEVWAVEIASRAGADATTDQSGAFAIDGLPPGDYELQFSPPYSSGLMVQWWDEGDTPEDATIITLSAGQTYNVGDVTLRRGGSIKGVIKDPAGRPLETYLQVLDLDGHNDWDYDEWEAWTEEDGSFGVFRMAPGDYVVHIYSLTEGLVGQWWKGARTFSQATRLTVTSAGESHDLGDVTLARGGNITGVAKDGSGNPVIGVDVAVYDVNDPKEVLANATTWEGGAFELHYLPPGEYRLYFDVPESLGLIDQWWKGVASWDDAAIVSVAGGEETSLGEVILADLSVVGETPSVSGTVVVGSTLTASTGTWSPSDVAFGYQWLRNGAPIAGATAKTYTLVAGDRGSAISVQVTGSRAGLPAVAVTSAATAEVAAGALGAATPSIGGTALVGSPLSVSVGLWSPQPDGFSYEWLRAGLPIAGAAGPVYTAVADDAGKAVSVRVTGVKHGYASKPATSGAVTVAVAALSVAPVPVVSGEVKVNGVLTANAGSWGPAPVTVAFQWLRGGSPIAGATGQKYTVQAGDVGKALSVRVTGSKPGYATVSKVSAVTSVVPKALKLKTTPAPKIKGTVRVGSKLTVSSGTWKPKPVPLTVQWFRAGVSAPIATGTSYTLTAADKGKKITVRVTGAKVGYAPVTKSKTTKKVAAGKLSTATPKVTGSAKVGSKLTASTGAWKPAPVTLGFQWLRNGKKIAGATGGSYVLTVADKGKTVSVKVTGSKPGYATVSKTSKKTKKVAA